MSAFKGTPGPWEVCNSSDVFTRLGARNASGAVAAENDGWHIADCDMGPSSTGEGEADIPHAEKRANARLISAAPDSFAANVQMVDALNVAFGITSEHDDDYIYDTLPTSSVATAYFAARGAPRGNARQLVADWTDAALAERAT